MRRVLKALKFLAVIVALVFFAAQFYGPATSNPPVNEARAIEAHAQLTPEVAGILARSCDDCHSNKTSWPWYSRVAPASWLVVEHVNEARSELNFSDWAAYDRHEADRHLDNICRITKHGSMPLSSYTLIHRNAKLSPGDVRALCDWTASERSRLAAGSAPATLRAGRETPLPAATNK